MSYGQFNQFKLINVQNGKFLIRTVMTGNESEVESLKESEELTLPKGIKLFDTPGMGTTINYPLKK